MGSFSNIPTGASTLLSQDVIDKLTKSLSDHSKNLSKMITKEQFFEVCGDSSAHVSNVKLSRARYKFFLTQRYGAAIAEKLHHTLDFNAGPIEFSQYCKQVELLCGERDHLMQLAFDILDTNNDDKVSELDLFKTMFHMCKTGNSNIEGLFS